jgi:hypothetical protein
MLIADALQVPNFLLATPMLALTVLGLRQYLRDCVPAIKAIWEGRVGLAAWVVAGSLGVWSVCDPT